LPRKVKGVTMRYCKSRFMIVVISLFFIFVLFESVIFAHDTEENRRSLFGIEAIKLLIENIDPEIEKEGLTKKQIQTDVELKLRMAGIKLLSMKEGRDSDKNGLLYVVISVIKISESAYNYSIDIEFHQNVYLVRDIKEQMKLGLKVYARPYFTETWSDGSIGITHNLGKIRNSVKDLTDTFINAYLSVQPRRVR
jgi:hypothetical protein